MRAFLPTLDDCIRAVYEYYRQYGLSYKELSFEDVGQIAGLVYSIVNLRLIEHYPQFYTRREIVSQSGTQLPYNMITVVNVRRLSDGVVYRYCSPQEWLQCNTVENAGAGLMGGHVYEPIYTVWGGYFVDPSVVLTAPPTRTTTGVSIGVPMYHGGTYIYYMPYNSGEVVVDMITIPALPAQGPLFEEQIIQVVPSVFDSMVAGIVLFSLMALPISYEQQAKELAEAVAEVWRNFVLILPPSVTTIKHDNSSAVSPDNQTTSAQTLDSNRYRG